MKTIRKPVTGLLALGLALAMPLAFAQDTDGAAQSPTTPTDQAAAAGAQGGQLTWSDLDSDGDGNLSRAEAGALPELASVFDQADADGDGVLTPQEYQQYAESQGAPPAQDDR